MTVEVRRSPAKVCWWVLVNGTLLQTADTKKEAESVANTIKYKYL